MILILHIIAGMLAVFMMKHCMVMEGNYEFAKKWSTFITTYAELFTAILVISVGFFSFFIVGIIWLGLMCKGLPNKKLPWAKDNDK